MSGFFFNSSITVVGLILSTRAVSRIPLPLTAISRSLLFYLWQIASVTIVLKERTATAFRISAAITLLTFITFTVSDDVGGVAAWAGDRFQYHRAIAVLTSHTNIPNYLIPYTGVEHYPVRNPNKAEESRLREPQEILDEIAALDAESAEILAGIGGMV